ncbi:Winged helix-turn-helix transcription repressor DNA-binding [Penicillium concentricum]|uniref:Winged helix-turn-helix transcription repressor DNA-binding n=1 Tax=Penicillium concentricum TaxID=293559 RepID=A0A9W9VJ11_9EURO|nr:Winged helix-turn-helix transcription repressor DNA-binding [Penicillium concentricum]KAJ5382614.1 Winged helix-turn-helix transcription repressor DNA-binding [Penicillium concentricum]
MSSQTMTAPAVGHRPPDPGSDSPLYDYGCSPNTTTPSNPRDDSAIRDMQNNSAPSTPNGMPAPDVAIKTECSDNNDFSAAQHQQDANTQSAASALLAQLLGNQPAANATPTTIQPAQDDQDLHMDIKMDDSISQSFDMSAQNPTHIDPSLNQDTASISREIQDLLNGKALGDELMGTNSAHHDMSHTGFNSSDAMNTLSDPMNPKLNNEQPSLLPALDFSAAPKNAFEALQQNELLTAAFLSQNADLSALGYQDMAASIAGSEPKIQAFAKLEFDDGHFYVNTYSFILGRDVRAARAAHHREFQYRQAVRSTRAKSSSGGNTSHTPNRMKREESAAMLGSVVSDRGGIMGFDPDIPPHLPNNMNMSRRSSKSSFDEAVVPLHANPAQLQSTTDYNALAMQSLQDGNGDAKPVDALALLPSPDSCPTIPIHPPTTVDGSAAGHRGISRRHVRISYNFDRNLFEMEVMGRNGAFIGADWLSPGQVRPLHSGDYIQIGGVRIRFLLPDVPIGETGADRMEEKMAEKREEEEEKDARASIEMDDDIDESERLGSDSGESREPSKKIILKTKDSKSSQTMDSIEPGDNDSQPARRRGPGRPPKDGIMSKRERAELAREQKNAAKREANGGITPPPPKVPKAGKTVAKESVVPESPKPSEKRKYTKRKKPDGTPMDSPLPSTEGGQMSAEPPQEYVKPPPVKKRKPSRSPSPNYPPESAYNAEDLAKPPYNYAVLIFDALTEAGTPMTLKQIYRALKLKYPYFRFKCETEGWTSSVRHNLNGNGHLFMHAERDGKGWSWQLIPGASVEKEKKRRPSPPPQVSHPPTPAPQQYMPMSHSYAPPPQGPPPVPNPPQHFQFPSIPPAPFPASVNVGGPPHSSPYPPPSKAPAPTPPAPPPAPPAAQPPASAPAPAPAPAPPINPAASFPIPSQLRNNLPAAFAATIPSTYTSPYASAPAPQAGQQQQLQTPRPPHGPPQHHSPYAQQKPPSSQPPHNNPQPRAYPPSGGTQFQHQHQHQNQHQQHQPPVQPQSQPLSHPPQQQHPLSHHQHQPQHQQHQHPQHQQHPHQHHPPPGLPAHSHHQQQQQHPVQQNSAPGPQESSSFIDRANKAIDDFEAVLMEDYEDKNYIREVLRSARARVLGDAPESSFPGGEPKDEAVIMDVLRNLVGSLKDE